MIKSNNPFKIPVSGDSYCFLTESLFRVRGSHFDTTTFEATKLTVSNFQKYQNSNTMNSFFKLSVKTLQPLVLICLFMAGFTGNALAQIPKQQGRCTATASQIYFVEDGQMRMDVYPSAPRGYQLNILGTGVDNFEVVQEPHIASVSVIPSYTSPTAAKWQISFTANMERVICSVTMKNKCTGETRSYPLTVGVRLFNR